MPGDGVDACGHAMYVLGVRLFDIGLFRRREAGCDETTTKAGEQMRVGQPQRLGWPATTCIMYASSVEGCWQANLVRSPYEVVLLILPETLRVRYFGKHRRGASRASLWPRAAARLHRHHSYGGLGRRIMYAQGNVLEATRETPQRRARATLQRSSCLTAA